MPSIVISLALAWMLAVADQAPVKPDPAPAGPTPEAPGPSLEGEAPAPAAASIALEALFAGPRPWLGREVRFTFQLADLPPSWNPCMTRFGTGDYAAARVWADGQLLWRESDWLNPIGLVFARRGGPLEDALAGATAYQRFTARGRVVELFLGRPWIELVELRPEPQSIGEGTILHASRALRLMESEDWQLAREDLSRALAGPLPDRARAELERLRATCEEGLSARAARRIPVQRNQ